MVVVILISGILGGATCAAFAALADAHWLLILLAYSGGGMVSAVGQFLLFLRTEKDSIDSFAATTAMHNAERRA